MIDDFGVRYFDLRQLFHMKLKQKVFIRSCAEHNDAAQQTMRKKWSLLIAQNVTRSY
ncbi:hypothetical protein EZMO1_0144 [Endozoicomonas montiporae CL-33]|uniref:Uncharacterized protein n=1 Tax=Endozoicomonas montiporae CL-33 TaxID=570277 RepID=A0A142B6N8_9GAMM|nr:hypothetical protein EZMO1_0144 [Endozoicomonas montiporae CL-33]